MTTQRATRRRKPEASTLFLPVLLKMVKGEGKPFSTSWLVDVERVYIPLNLDNHWVAMEMNLKASRITVYDSLRSTTHSWKAYNKISLNLLFVAQCPTKHVEGGEGGILAHHCKSKGSTARQRGDCEIFTLKVIKFLFVGLPLDLIKPQNVLAFQLRMAVDMLHRVQNV
ncbi:hypothetical protein D8674_021625 [Pyrus ussuriensis x Pyrus communis]|uniref:Ubiquitin-like protease family profile domain-containing protein n=1 Tax=Pyrus ussuriensis x Pyrus communis TaxID=2448454 RepID=A0A5N5GIT1_9ROSA|nr:hypothetical protein D8674_021625 [Pyrus ussuriensis x Pyrus communis]